MRAHSLGSTAITTSCWSISGARDAPPRSPANTPTTGGQSSEQLPALRQATLACLQKFGPRVRYYTSSVAVQDLDQVRRVLGYPRIDLYAASYGTRMAELYMRRYPGATHAAILDGVTYPQQAIGPDTPLDGERALNLILTRCLAAPDCTAAYPDVRRDLDILRRRFGPETAALTLTDPSSGLPLAIEFNRSVLSAALRFLSYNATEASLLPALIHQAAAGRLAALAAQTVMLARQVGDQLASGMQNSVICSEDVPFFAADQIDRARLAQTYQGTEQLDALTEICKLWPRGPVDPALHSALHSAVPSLLLSGEADPVTPPADAERLAQGLGRYRHLVLQRRGARPVGDRLRAQADGRIPGCRGPAGARCNVSRAPSSGALLRGRERSLAMIEAKALCKRFGSIDAVREVSFVARDGEITGLLGPNGAGKSTTLRMLYGVLTPDSGSACIDGIDIRGETSSRARASRGAAACRGSVRQSDRTRKHRILRFAAGHLPRPPAQPRGRTRARALGMQGFIERRVKGFSQGQRIKVALARALVHDPANLVLDEPTNGLDVMAIRNLRDMLKDLKSQGRCILFSSHVMQEVAALCDQVVIIGGGRVLAQGTLQSIREHERDRLA